MSKPASAVSAATDKKNEDIENASSADKPLAFSEDDDVPPKPAAATQQGSTKKKKKKKGHAAQGPAGVANKTEEGLRDVLAQRLDAAEGAGAAERRAKALKDQEEAERKRKADELAKAAKDHQDTESEAEKAAREERERAEAQRSPKTEPGRLPLGRAASPSGESAIRRKAGALGSQLMATALSDKDANKDFDAAAELQAIDAAEAAGSTASAAAPKSKAGKGRVQPGMGGKEAAASQEALVDQSLLVSQAQAEAERTAAEEAKRFEADQAAKRKARLAELAAENARLQSQLDEDLARQAKEAEDARREEEARQARIRAALAGNPPMHDEKSSAEQEALLAGEDRLNPRLVPKGRAAQAGRATQASNVDIKHRRDQPAGGAVSVAARRQPGAGAHPGGNANAARPFRGAPQAAQGNNALALYAAQQQQAQALARAEADAAAKVQKDSLYTRLYKINF